MAFNSLVTFLLLTARRNFIDYAKKMLILDCSDLDVSYIF